MHKSVRWWGEHDRSTVSFLGGAAQSFRRARQRVFLRNLGPLLISLWAFGPAAAMAADPPEVNGLFYGDGDDARYTLWDTSYYNSNLYVHYEAPTTTLYVALVVDRSVNDNVFGDNHPGYDGDYMESAGWGQGRGQHRSAADLINSEFAGFEFACAVDSPNTWAWQQGYACRDGNGEWVSDSSCQTSSVVTNDYPPSLDSASSFAQNMNTYESASPGPWNRDVFGSTLNDWKSPFDTSDPNTEPPNNPNTVIGLDGYPAATDSTDLSLGPPITYSEDFQYEWSMVYEWSIDVGSAGTDCGANSLFLITGSSHHSPMKEGVEGDHDDVCGEENDCFPDDPDPDPLSDFGDLPDSYGTVIDSNGAQHPLTVNGPYLGEDVEFELDGNPSEDATKDGPEEDGVTVNVSSNWTPGSNQTIDVVVSNAPSGALLGGWFDWNNDGDFEDSGEFFTWNVSEGSDNTLPLTVGSGFDWQEDNLYARFRVFSSSSAAPGGSLTQADYVGTAANGEVEDYYYEPGSLPVTLNAFESRFVGDGLKVEWQTASETNNVGFELWGRTYAGEWQVLSDLIPSKGMNASLPQSYELSVTLGSEIEALGLVDYDTRGRPERFGPFTPGEAYGEVQPVERIDWEGPRLERQQRLQARGFVNMRQRSATNHGKSSKRHGGQRTGDSAKRSTGRPAHAVANRVVADYSKRERFRKLVQPGQGNGRGGNPDRSSSPVTVAVPAAAPEESEISGSLTGVQAGQLEETVTLQTGPVTHVAVTEPGIQRVSYEALRDAGLDLVGVDHRQIAVTSRGEPVARWIEGYDETFGPGQWIEFIGRPPQGDEALYIESNLYQVSVDVSRARPAGRLGQGRARQVSASRQGESMVNRPQLYHPQSPTGDPWIEQVVLVPGDRTASVKLELPVAGPVADGEATLEVGLGTISNFPDRTDGSGAVIPEHNVHIELAGPDGEPIPVAMESTSGQQDWTIEATLPSTFLEPDTYELRLHFSTEYFFSLVVVDRYGVRYPTTYDGPRLDFAPDTTAGGYRIEDLDSASLSAYAEGSDGSLTRIDPRMEWTGHGYAAELRQVEAERLWVDEAPRTPDVFTTQAPGDLLAEAGDLVVITDSSFIGSRALEDYVRDKSAYNPVVVDVEDIYNSVGYGMALPGAITDYLRARSEVHDFTYVQLVGTDCYDRLNYISECLSLIPLPTARVGMAYYSPSQNRLVDLDSDGVGDKPVGQFSVRHTDELATIVAKGSHWRSNVAGKQSALLIADSSDGEHDFLGQIKRLDGKLDWDASEILNLADHSDIANARDDLKASLDEGRALTMFSGHSSPAVWSFQSLLSTSSAKNLTNGGKPTTMVPLACETTYDIGPNANVLGHQLLYAGEQGAVAISGAVSLSSLEDNERMANHIIDGMKAGLTLGEAVQQGREALGPAFRNLHDNWLTQGDVTTSLSEN